MNIEVIWKNIQCYERSVFKTVRGKEYKYVIYNDYLLINDDKRRKVTKESLKCAIAIENPSPSKLSRVNIWGPSYVCGIITDERIKY